MAISCCKGCIDREVGCHATCDRYIKEKENHEALKRKIRKNKKRGDLQLDILFDYDET